MGLAFFFRFLNRPFFFSVAFALPLADVDGDLAVPSSPSTLMTSTMPERHWRCRLWVQRLAQGRPLRLRIAAARLVLLALAIVAEHVATVGLSSGARTRGASCHGSGAALCRSSGSTPVNQNTSKAEAKTYYMWGGKNK
ncbi:hypothetical protein C4D60_Mb09t20910 [Musa balbisiana]|uniref:CASP-like protein n=1 Tax=Musa balbisiana TaxID=52838 RepID=A0A4S8IHZ9_MUSBA|nr:hypothetical protein C4D60_Mb09t20910 [Musa balbisiana]